MIKQTHKSKLLNDQATHFAKEEVELHKTIDHSNIIQLFDSWETEQSIVLQLEFCNHYEYFEETLNEVSNFINFLSLSCF